MLAIGRQYQMRILEILAENLKNSRPEPVRSERLGRLLDMRMAEIRQILRSMHEMGVVESDMDGEYFLITRSGLTMLGDRGGLDCAGPGMAGQC